MDRYDWNKALDYILYVASNKNISQTTLSKNLISLSHFNNMCNGKENIKPDIILQCAKRAGITDSKILEIARSKENIIFLEIYDSLEEILVLQDYQSLPKLKKMLEPHKEKDKNFTELYYHILGLIECILHANYNEGLKYFKKGLRTVYPKKKLNEILIPNYLNSIDLELISSIANCYKHLKQYHRAIEIYLELIQFFDSSTVSTVLYPKNCYNLARTYEKIKDYKNELKYANLGLEYSITHQIYEEFGYLYFAKAMAQYYLRLDNTESFDLCIYHYKLQQRDSEFIKEILKDKEKYSRKNSS